MIIKLQTHKTKQLYNYKIIKLYNYKISHKTVKM